MFRTMRRSNQQMKQVFAEQILHSATSGVLSLCGEDGYPYGVPMSFVYNAGKLYFHSARSGHKVDAIRQNEKASYTVVVQDDIVPERYTTLYRSVIAFGKIHVVEDETERLYAIQLLAEKYNAEGNDASWRKEINDCPNFLVLGMDVEHLTGKASRELVE